MSENGRDSPRPGRAEKSNITPERLAQLRAMPYAEYLRTGEWNRRRMGAILRAGKRCQICNSDQQLQVHHRSYKHLGQEPANDLICLCRSCHDLFTRHGRLIRA